MSSFHQSFNSWSTPHSRSVPACLVGISSQVIHSTHRMTDHFGLKLACFSSYLLESFTLCYCFSEENSPTRTVEDTCIRFLNHGEEYKYCAAGSAPSYFWTGNLHQGAGIEPQGKYISGKEVHELIPISSINCFKSSLENKIWQEVCVWLKLRLLSPFGLTFCPAF